MHVLQNCNKELLSFRHTFFLPLKNLGGFSGKKQKQKPKKQTNKNPNQTLYCSKHLFWQSWKAFKELENWISSALIESFSFVPLLLPLELQPTDERTKKYSGVRAPFLVVIRRTATWASEALRIFPSCDLGVC